MVTEKNQVDYLGVDELFDTENKLVGYNRDIVLKMLKSISKKEKVSEILEFGAGIGTLARLWNDILGVKPDCLEIDKKLCKILEERGFCVFQSLESIGNIKKYDVIYTSNVLEHIEDDIATLKQLKSLLNEDGIIIIYVPAFMCLYSEMDKSVKHYRRYSKKELVNKVSGAGFKIIDCYFADSVGFFASLFIRFFGYKNNLQLGGPKSLEMYDKYIYPLSYIADLAGCRKLFGKNLLLVAKKGNS